MRYRIKGLIWEQEQRRHIEKEVFGEVPIAFDFRNEPDIPDGGSIAFEIAVGRWLTFSTSEWGEVFLEAKPAWVQHE